MDWYLHFKATEMFFGLAGSLEQTSSWQADVWQAAKGGTECARASRPGEPLWLEKRSCR